MRISDWSSDVCSSDLASLCSEIACWRAFSASMRGVTKKCCQPIKTITESRMAIRKLRLSPMKRVFLALGIGAGGMRRGLRAPVNLGQRAAQIVEEIGPGPRQRRKQIGRAHV